MIRRGCALLLLIPFFTTGCFWRPTPQKLLREWGLQAQLHGDFKLERWEKLPPSQEFFARGPSDSRLRAENFSAGGAPQAADFLNQRVRGLLRNYDTRPEPYQGTVTRTVECPIEFKPRVHESSPHGAKKIEVRLFANASLAFGACTADSAAYLAVITGIYCERTGTVSWVEYFTRKNQKPPPPDLELECRGDSPTIEP